MRRLFMTTLAASLVACGGGSDPDDITCFSDTSSSSIAITTCRVNPNARTNSGASPSSGGFDNGPQTGASNPNPPPTLK